MAETKKMKIGLSNSDKNQMKNEIEGRLNESFDLKSKEIDTKLKNQDDTIKGLGKLHPSGTATESEIMAFTSDKGIYIGTDTGNWYYWSANGNIYVSGGAYQSSEDIEQIKKDLVNNTYSQKKSYGNNLFNKNMTITYDKYVNSDGLLAPNTSGDYSVSDFIPVKPNTTYSTNVANGAGKTACYDKYREMLSENKTISETSVNGVLQFTTPSNCYYVRMTIVKASYSALPENAIVNEGTTLITYQDYTENGALTNLTKLPLGKRLRKDILNANEGMNFNAPNVKSGNTITFDATIETEITKIDIRHGYDEPYSASFIRLTNTNISVEDTVNGESQTREKYEHGLSLTKHISVIIDVYKIDRAKLTITTTTGQFVKDIYWEGCRGDIAVWNHPNSSKLTNVELTYNVSDYNKPIWAYGDSYFDYWCSIAQDMGYDNCLFDGFGGRTSIEGYNSLFMSLNYKTPKAILWCLGMNDPDSDTEINSNWKNTFDKLNSLCSSKDIKLIVTTIPNTPTHNHTFKNTYIKKSGVMYIDVAEALGASEANSTWYDGLLSSDNIHPTYNYGKQVIASKICSSLPELLGNKPISNYSKLEILNDYVTATNNKLYVKDGVVYVRFEGTANTDIPNGTAFAKVGTTYCPTGAGVINSRMAINGSLDWSSKLYWLSSNQGSIYTGGTITSGSFITFMFSYYLGYWNYEIEE